MDLHAITKQSQFVYGKIYAASTTRSHAMDPLPAYMAEGTFAVQYLLKEDDLIADQVPGIGLVDDAILIKRVFSLNVPEFMRLETLPAIA